MRFTAIALAYLLAAACAETAYSVSLRPLADNPPPWLTDGPDSEIIAWNRTDTRVRLTVQCAGAPQDWIVEVEPHSRTSAIGQLMAINTRGDACCPSRAENLTPRGWEEIPLGKEACR